MFCKHCANQLTSNDRICPVCGHPVGEIDSVAKKKNPTQVLLILVLVTLIMALVVVSLLIVYKINREPYEPGHQVVIVNPTPEPTAEATSTPTPTESPTPSPSPTPTPTATPAPTQTPTPTPMPTPTFHPAPTQENGPYQTYVNREYGFSCVYPSDFYSITPQGEDAVKTYISADSTAVMTIRAVWNTGGLTLDDVYEDFQNSYGANITYHPREETWYAAKVEWGERSFYRKLFLKNGMICCMDFEYQTKDLDIYGPHIEYIEDHFTTKID